MVTDVVFNLPNVPQNLAILADNGAPWYITGVPDTRWNDDELHHLQDLTGADFEVVNTSSLRNG